MYFTSWDANVFLCLLSVFPEEVVRGMIKMVKKTHEDYCLEDARAYYCNLDIYKLYRDDKYYPSNPIKEFKHKWRWRSPIERRRRIANHTTDYWTPRRESYRNRGKETRTGYWNYWNSGDAWSYSILDRNLDTSEWSEDEEFEYFDMKYEQRKKYVGDWYYNIHEGRYFLFFKENDIVPSDYLDKHRHNPLTSIMVISDTEQVAQDLLTIDGGGLGEKPGNHIEHIDDLFP